MMKFKALSFALSSLLVLSACAEAPVDSVVNYPPPDAEVETMPTIDDPSSQVWIPGYWQLSGGSFSWVSGEVVARPAPTAVWAPARWVRHSYGWAFVGGHWE